MAKKTLIGPFTQLLTMAGISPKGKLVDDHLRIIPNAGIVVEGSYIFQVDSYENLRKQDNYRLEIIKNESVALPGLIDAHTHICYAGSRVNDFIARISGKSYVEIANQGGGIMTTVNATRKATFEELKHQTKLRAEKLIRNGVTTIEVKSGYGLNIPDEIKMLKIINELDSELPVDLIPTCLAAHTKPADYKGSNKDYLDEIANELLPYIKENDLTNRVDIFVEKTEFQACEARKFLQSALDMGFKLTVHGDQFTLGGSSLAVELGAVSVDHLEVSCEKEINALARSDTVAVVLPGASLGLGLSFAPARKLLDKGASLVIASDFNPGSAPMGDLLLQACLLATYEKLTPAEMFSAITCRAARVLSLENYGCLEKNFKADFIAFDCADYKEIIYYQGSLKPSQVWKNGKQILKL